MKFSETGLAGAFVVDVEDMTDERGILFARTWDRARWTEMGLDAEVAQSSVSFTADRGTLRGLHYQAAPHEETKLVRCTRGAIFDVIVDLRGASSPPIGAGSGRSCPRRTGARSTSRRASRTAS